MLRIAFRRCHNFIHGNEGMPKDQAFWQFLYLIFAKMHDEKQGAEQRRFWAGPGEQFDPDGRVNIRARITPLFDEVKQEFSNIFRGNEEIELSDRALAFMVSELAKYELGRTDVDAKGAAYQEIVGTNLRGDRGQSSSTGDHARLDEVDARYIANALRETLWRTLQRGKDIRKPIVGVEGGLGILQRVQRRQ